MSRLKDAQKILDFWFGVEPNEPRRNAKLWYKKDPDFDNEIREKFLNLVEQAKNQQLDSWLSEASGWVATIILLDQFTRNIYRDSPEAFASDELARQIVRKGITLRIHKKLTPVHAWFFYMPLMHSENLQDQDDGIELFQALADSAPENIKDALMSVLDFAHRHREIVARFGRFPHRNNILGRASTEEEVQFLTQPGSSF